MGLRCTMNNILMKCVTESESSEDKSSEESVDTSASSDEGIMLYNIITIIL